MRLDVKPVFPCMPVPALFSWEEIGVTVLLTEAVGLIGYESCQGWASTSPR